MTISEWLELGLAVSGVLILAFTARAFQSKRAWEDGAEYEMLGLPVPGREEAPSGAGSPETGDGRGGVAAGAGPRAAVAGTSRATGSGEAGALGVADRVVRFGLCVALSYLGFTWFGAGSPAMIAAMGAVVYLFVTLLVGKDPVYRLRGWSTGQDESRSWP